MAARKVHSEHSVPAQQFGDVQRLLTEGQYFSALNAALKLRASFPDALAPITLAVRASMGLGDEQNARNLALQATQLRPRNVAARILYAQTLVRSGDAPQAFALLRQIEDSAAARPGALRRVARFHRQYGCGKDAFRVTLKAMELEPDDVDTVYRAALLAHRLGRPSEARALCRRVISIDPDHIESCLLRSVLDPARPGEHHLDALGFLLEAHPDENPQRAGLCQALGRELEDLGQFDAAFASYAEAARLRTIDPSGNPLLNAASTDAIEKAYQALTRLPLPDPSRGPSSEVPGADRAGDLFLLGLPCAGFEAFRRWLDAQTPFQSIGKIDPLRWLIDRPGDNTVDQSQPIDEAGVRRFAVAYEECLRHLNSLDSSWFLHDSPGCFVYFGLLRHALPRARFIHLRRDPLDQCVELFCPEPGELQLSAGSLDALCEHFTAYHRLMGFSRRHFPGAMLEIDYAQFVAEPERVWESICRFLSLEPQKMPSFKKLVDERPDERPDERIGRSRRFSSALATLARRLQANGVPVS